MKKVLLPAMLLMLAMGSVQAAQTKRTAAPPPYAAFWSEFKAAVIKGDSQKVASMTRFPFLFQNDEQNEAGFIKKFNVLFPARVKSCFAKAKTVKERDGFEVFCGESIYLFEKVDGVYKFTEIGVND